METMNSEISHSSTSKAKKLQNATTSSQEPRSMCLKFRVVTDVKGSAYMEYGNTKVMVVIDRAEATNIVGNMGSAPVVTCSASYFPTNNETTYACYKEDMLSASIQKVLNAAICREKVNYQLNVTVTILDDDGCVLSTAINCCGAALIAADVPIFDIITASTIGYYDQMTYVNPDANIESLFSLTNEKAKHQQDFGIVTIANFASSRQVIGCFQRGMLSRSSFGSLIQKAQELNDRLSLSLKAAFLENLKDAAISES